ncbi:MAG: hypothetical protein EZS28_010397 [Streblomastix strix]|uniref:Uncharacterized protein n=1 Tax=Streblomastix strix TaxID=222440 RepID=A0A5J4WHC0_9EUKA|nr:MAG: hypothetical protein EZS28_010397 [Streblomastix strix]
MSLFESLTNRISEFDLNQIEKEARQKFEAEKSQGAGDSGAGGLMEVDGMEDDYDYYESQPARQDRMKSRTKPFGRLPFHPTEDIDARIKEAFGQAMKYYGQMLTQRQQQIGGFDLAKYKFQ